MKVDLDELARVHGSERHVISRIESELRSRGWGQAELARRMEEVAGESTGGVLHASVISKLLRGDTGRHISIDQLISLATVFEVPVAELLLPPGVAGKAEALELLTAGPALERSATTATWERDLAVGKVVTAAAEDASLRETFRRVIESAEPDDDSFTWRFYARVLESFREMTGQDL